MEYAANVARAALTAMSASAALPIRISAILSSVAGLMTAKRPASVVGLTNRPLM